MLCVTIICLEQYRMLCHNPINRMVQMSITLHIQYNITKSKERQIIKIYEGSFYSPQHSEVTIYEKCVMDPKSPLRLDQG